MPSISQRIQYRDSGGAVRWIGPGELTDEEAAIVATLPHVEMVDPPDPAAAQKATAAKKQSTRARAEKRASSAAKKATARKAAAKKRATAAARKAAAKAQATEGG